MEQDNESVGEQQKRQIKQLLARISYNDDPDSSNPKRYQYPAESIMPFLHFYKLLALRPCQRQHKYRLRLNVPDTIIFNDKDSALMWIFTDQRGEVARIDNLPYNTITSKLTEGAVEKQLVAVLKKSQYGYGGISGNDVKVVSAAEMKTVLSSVLSTRSQVSVLQRFVKSQSVKPSILRTCWRKNGTHQGWILSSNYQYTSNAKVNQICKFIVNTKMPKGFSAVRCGSQRYLKQTLTSVQGIAKWVQRHLGIGFLELVCDFVKDQGGNWWYINTKAFVLANPAKIDPRAITMHDDVKAEGTVRKKLQTYTRCRKCRYCWRVVAQHLMTHKLTLMMLLQCDQHLVRLGKDFPWLERAYSLHLDSVNLYVEHKVCDSCYRFYREVQRLVGLQRKLAILTGTVLPADDKNAVSITSVPYFKGHSAQFGTRLQKLQYDPQMPSGWRLPLQHPLKVQLESERTTLQRYRLMLYFHGLRDIPVAFRTNNKRYYIQCKVLGEVIKFGLPLRNAQDSGDGLCTISIDKIKLFHLFAGDRGAVKDYIRSQQVLKIELIEDEEIFGTLQLELEEFKSEKVIKRDFFKMFSGKKVFPYLSWGLFISVGLAFTGTLPTAALKLTQHQSVLLPEPTYHNADPIPEDWIAMIRQKPDRKLEPALSQQSYYQQDNSKIFQKGLKNTLTKQLQEYSRRKAPSSHQGSRRKPYYI